jgi:hypothetical protein
MYIFKVQNLFEIMILLIIAKMVDVTMSANNVPYVDICAILYRQCVLHLFYCYRSRILNDSSFKSDYFL